MARKKILDNVEAKVFDFPPNLNKEERKKYFEDIALSPRFIEITRSMSKKNKTYFIISLMYFTMTKRFFKELRPEDISFFCKKFGIEANMISEYSIRTKKRHQEIILKEMGFKIFTDDLKIKIYKIIDEGVCSQEKIRNIFYNIVNYLETIKVVCIGRREIEDIIRERLKTFDMNCYHVIKGQVSDKIDNLDKFFFKRSDAVDARVKYQTHLFKKINQSTKLKDIVNSSQELIELKNYYRISKEIINNLKLSEQGILNFSYFFRKADHGQLREMNKEKRIMYLSCFIVSQYMAIHDHFVLFLITSINSTLTRVKDDYRNYVFSLKQKKKILAEDIVNKQLEISLEVNKIEELLLSSKISNHSKVEKSLKKIQKIKKECKKINKSIIGMESLFENMNTHYDQILLNRSRKILKKIRHFIYFLDFDFSNRSENLKDDYTLLQEFYLKGKKQYSKEFYTGKSLDDEESRSLSNFKKDNEVRDLYEIFIYKKIADKVKSGDINISCSFNYRYFKKYLINENNWINERKDILELHGLEELSNPSKLIQNLNKEIDVEFAKLDRILKKKNVPFLKLTDDNKLIVKTPSINKKIELDADTNLFFSDDSVSLIEVLKTVNEATSFTKKLNHNSNKYIKELPSINSFLGGIIGIGCHIGVSKICKASKGLNLNEVSTVIDWYLSPENLKSANNVIIDYLNKLKLPKIYQSKEGYLQTSSDGQKWKVKKESLASQRSFKYFGKGKGIVINTHIDERHLIFSSKAIMPTEREANTVIDGLLSNEKIKSDMHSTDSHGVTEIIFAVLGLLKNNFSPRIKNIKKQRLYSINAVKNYNGIKLKPHAKINIKLIERSWEDILWILASIKSRRIESSKIFRRLSSYSKDQSIYKGLKELGKLFKTRFILRYYQDIDYRRKIEKQLNKVENSNKFSRAISFGNNQELNGGTLEEIEVIEGCKRLIKNAIICWNYLYLSKEILKTKNKKDRIKFINKIKKSSIIQWKHINMQGEYDFKDIGITETIASDLREINRLEIA